MIRTVLLAAAASVLLTAGLPTMAATSASGEKVCHEMATKNHIPAKEMQSYLKRCMAKHGGSAKAEQAAQPTTKSK